MIKVRWLKPVEMFDRQDDETDLVGATYLIIENGDFVNTHPFVLFRQQGWLHLKNDYVELLLWYPARVTPVMTAGIPEVKWLEATNVHSK